MKSLEEQVLTKLKKGKGDKGRYTFYLSEASKAALAAWCKEKDVAESAAIEEMIRTVIPPKYFKGA